MKKTVLALSIASLMALSATAAHAQIIRGARDNVAGGVTAGGAHDVRGPNGGRTVGEGGVVTIGDGAGVAGSRGCGRTAAGGRGCGAGSTVRDEDGSISHEQSAYGRGAFGNTASTQGSFERDEDGDWSGDRNSQVNVGDRTYSVDTTFESGDGWERDVECSGSGCPR
mgnify:CR=1 FL=1